MRIVNLRKHVDARSQLRRGQSQLTSSVAWHGSSPPSTSQTTSLSLLALPPSTSPSHKPSQSVSRKFLDAIICISFQLSLLVSCSLKKEKEKKKKKTSNSANKRIERSNLNLFKE